MSAKSMLECVRIGTSSFSSQDWVGPFYPDGTAPGSFLSYYATRFDTVEVDATYYAIPSSRTVDGWLAKTPEKFLLSAKFPRSIVHGGRGATPDPQRILLPETTYADRDRFLEVMRPLGPRLGPLVLQFPYFSKKVFADRHDFEDRLDRFLSDLPDGPSYAVEIRNRNWLDEDFAGLCRSHGVSLVLVDQAWMPMADELAARFDPITAHPAYIRLLGDRKEIEALTRTWDREVIDRMARLDRWARFLAELEQRRVPALVYVNNHYAGHAPTTAARLRELYERARSRPHRPRSGDN